MKIKHLAMCLLCLVLFQNCDSFVDDSGEASQSDQTQATADTLPFAYEMTVDHIAYMSCKGTNFHKGGAPFFSFKAGAYNSENGLKLKTSFLEQWGGYSTNKLIEFLDLSKRNSRAGVVMSVRDGSNMQRLTEFGDTNIVSLNSPDNAQITGMMYNPFDEQGTLTSNTLSKILLDNRSSATNYFKGLPGNSTRSFDGTIRLNQKENTTADSGFRNDLMDSSYLSFTYGTEDVTENPGLLARSPFDATGESSSANSSVWGKGYQFNFSQNDVSRTSSSKRVATGVLGYNLENKSSLGEQWVCPEDEKYIIVRNTVDALRRYDGMPLDPANNPFNDFDLDGSDDSDGSIDGPDTVPYADGGPAIGGYYHSFVSGEESATDENQFTRRKVICPVVPDEMADGQTEHTDPKWVRIRNILSPQEWYVFRGPKSPSGGRQYNCIVPKTNAGSCYGDFEDQLQSGIGGAFRDIQYFQDEDYPTVRLDKRRNDPFDLTEITVEKDCGGPGQPFCPHILSVCYKVN